MTGFWSALLQLAGGAALLFLGAEWLVRGGAGLARRWGVSPLIVGLTVVAYGTSAPEVVVGLRAGWGGHGELALGNVVGSNIANFGLILGLTALLKPTPVRRTLARIDVPVLLLTTLGLLLMFLDGRLAIWEACLLLLLAVGYSAWMVRRTAPDTQDHLTLAEDSAQTLGAPQGGSPTRLVVLVVAGLLLLVLGGHLLVEGASVLALRLGMSERLVGLTVVAVGTSLPELASCLVAAWRGHTDLAVGNVVGSNLFNILLCLGAAGLTGGVWGTPTLASLDFGALAVITLLALFLLRTERHIRRWEGALLLGTYGVYLVLTSLGG